MSSTKIYSKPDSIKEALECAALYKFDVKYIAGGTDIMPNKYQENDSTACLIDITNIKEFNDIKVLPDSIHIGSTCTLHSLANNEIIKSAYPTLIEAIKSVGSPLIRRTATLGGNLLCENRCLFYNQSEWWREAIGSCLKCNGDICIATGGTKACFSIFSSDIAPMLISIKAKIRVVNQTEDKIIPLESIYTGNGVNPRNITPDTLIQEIILPLNIPCTSVFDKLRQRECLEFTSLTVATTLFATDEIRIVLGGVSAGPVIIETNKTENIETTINTALKSSKTVKNDLYKREYRREMIRVFIQKSYLKLGI